MRIGLDFGELMWSKCVNKNSVYDISAMMVAFTIAEMSRLLTHLHYTCIFDSYEGELISAPIDKGSIQEWLWI